MNPIDPTAHQASSPSLFNGASVDFFSYQSVPQMPQNAMMNEHVKIPGLASLDDEQRSRSITPFMNQALTPTRANYLGQMPSQSIAWDSQSPASVHAIHPPSATHMMPSQDPRLPKNSPSTDRPLPERIAEFEYSTRPRPTADVFVETRSAERPSADRLNTIRGDARPANIMASNDAHQNEQDRPVAGTKRSCSPDDPHDDSGSDSVEGMMSRPARRRRAPGRRRLNGTLFQPARDARYAQPESEDGDSLFVPAQPRQLKAESSASPGSEVPASPTTKTSTARELKQRLAGKSTKVFSRKMNPEKDPENIAIKRMRCEERRQFDDIADMLNKARVGSGLEPTFTANAVYGRFQRIAPRIAALEGQPDFNYRDYLHIPRDAKPAVEPIVSLPAMTPRQETLFVEAYERVKKEVWVYTARKFRDMGGFELSPEQAALKFKSI